MSYDVLSTLPPDRQGHTRLALRDGRRKVALREVREGVETFLPERTPEAVLPLIELAEVQGATHAVYDFVPGVTLAELCDAHEDAGQPVPLGLVARVVADAARAVGELHGTHPPVPAHGGLSDRALLVGFDGATRVLDYGAPRPSRFQPSVPGGVHGDVFALGAVLHAALTGFAGVYADAVDEGLPLPPPSTMHDECTPALDDIVARALSRAFARRQVDGAALADELDAVLADGVLFSHAQVAEVVGRLFAARREGPGANAGASAVKIDAPAASLADDDAAPTGAHPAPWLRHDQTSPGLEPVRDEPPGKKPLVPWVTGMTGEDLPPAGPVEVAGTAPPAPIDRRTEPGRPGPMLANAVPGGTEPGRPGPFAPAAPAAERGGDSEGTNPGAPPPRPPAPPPPPAPPRPSVPPAPPRPSVPPAPSPAAEDEVPPPLEEAEPTRPRASIPRRAEAAASVLPPAVGADAPEDTRPRPRPSIDDTNPRPRPPIDAVDTNPRAASPVDQDTNPRAAAAALRPRNTSTHERLQARGQERIPTPPVGVPAAPSDDELGIVNEPTNVRPRPKSPDEAAGGSEGELSATSPATQPANRARVFIAALLLVMAVGLGAVALLAPQKFAALKVKLGLAKPPVEEPEAPEGGEPVAVEEDGDGGALAVAAADDDDGGVDEGEEEEDDDAGEALAVLVDAGVPRDAGASADAGTSLDAGARDAGASDGGASDAGANDAGANDAGASLSDGGTSPKPAEKTPPKKKKKRRRR